MREGWQDFSTAFQPSISTYHFKSDWRNMAGLVHVPGTFILRSMRRILSLLLCPYVSAPNNSNNMYFELLV